MTIGAAVLIAACIALVVGAGLGYYTGYTDASEERESSERAAMTPRWLRRRGPSPAHPATQAITPTIPDRERITPTPIYDDVVASALASDELAAEVEAWLTGRSTR